MELKHFKLFYFLLSLLPSGCAYSMGYRHQTLPQGVKRVSIEPFKNETPFVGPELDFTNQLIKEFQRAEVGKLVNSVNDPEGLFKGRVISIQRIQRTREAQPRGGDGRVKGWVNLPPGTLITTEYLLRVKVQIDLVQKATRRVIWTQIFTDEITYPSSRVVLETINTALPNYNSSEEQRIIKVLAGVMMQEAVRRLTENF